MLRPLETILVPDPGPRHCLNFFEIEPYTVPEELVIDISTRSKYSPACAASTIRDETAGKLVLFGVVIQRLGGLHSCRNDQDDAVSCTCSTGALGL